MRNLHCGGRFLRFLRSICSKTACARRAIVALFVVASTILATFMIAPTYALSAGEGAGVNAGANTASTEKVEGAKTDGDKPGSTKTDVEQQPQSESNSAEPDKKDTGSSSTLTNNNKESKSVEKQQNADAPVDKAKSEKFADETDAKKKVEGAKKKDVSTETALKMNRSAKKPIKLKECSTLSTCYNVSYNIGSPTVDHGKTILIKRGDARTITPEFKVKPKKKPATNLLDGLRFELEKDGEDLPSWVNFEKIENGVSPNGFVTLSPGKWDRGIHKFKIGIYHPADKKGKKIEVSVKIDESDVQSGDLKLDLYDFGNKEDKTPVSDNKITINPKSNSQGASGGSTSSTDKKDTYDFINKLFIDSQSKDKPGYIYHHMICHKTGSDDSKKADGKADSYTLDSVNGLSLGTQTQFKHAENQTKPSTGADAYTVYEKGDDITERSQRWISGKPKDDGTFECIVFAIKDTKLIYNPNGPGGKSGSDSTVAKEFETKVTDPEYRKLLFTSSNPESNIVDSGMWTNSNDITKTIDWNYKLIKIQFGGKDLALKVYPFKNSDGSLPYALTDKNNKISAMLGMELKPFVDATSAEDSKNKITLRVLCSKGEKKNAAAGGGAASTGGTGSTDGNSSTGSTGSGSAVSDSSGASTGTGSQPTQPSGSSQPAKPSQAEEPLEYKTWSSNLAELGLSVPEDTKQTRCNEAGDGKCTADKVASQSSMEVSIKPTDVGNYQCVVYALKPKALAKFDGLTGSLTPDSIKSELTKVTEGSPTAFKENMDFAAFTLDINLESNFTLPNAGERNWNLQLGIFAALLVNLLAAGFVVSQSERGRKLILGRWRGLCNHV